MRKLSKIIRRQQDNHLNQRQPSIEEAVRWRVFHRTVQSIKDQNADTDPGELQRLIDSAVLQVRAERGVKGKVRKA